MIIGWIGQEKYFVENFKCYCLLHFADIYHYYENTKQLNNEIKYNNRNKSCHVNVLCQCVERSISRIITSILFQPCQACTKSKRQELKNIITYVYLKPIVME